MYSGTMICLAAVIIPKPSAQQKSKLFCSKKNYTIFFLHWGPPRGYMLTSEWCVIEQFPKKKSSIIKQEWEFYLQIKKPWFLKEFLCKCIFHVLLGFFSSTAKCKQAVDFSLMVIGMCNMFLQFAMLSQWNFC